MRFMYIVTSPQSDTGPTPALMGRWESLADREIKAAACSITGGLLPIAGRCQVKITNGKLGVIDGPFVETKERSAASDLRTPGPGDRWPLRGSSCSAPRAHA